LPAPRLVKLAPAPSPIARLVDDYLASCRAAGLSPKTVRFSYGYPLRSVFLPWCAEQAISDVSQITNRRLDELGAALQDKGHKQPDLSKATVWSYMKAVNRFLTWAKEEGEDVDARGRLPKLDRKVIEVLSRQEIEAMEHATATERDALIIRLLADTGMRIGELVALRTNDLTEKNHQHLLRIRGKGGMERLVPVPPALYRRLTRYATSKRPADVSGNRLFISSRRASSGLYEPLTQSGVAQMIRDVAEKAGIERRVHPHLFRHSAATYYLQRGMDSLLVAQLLGHTSLAMIQRVYSHLNTSDVHEAMLRALTKET
jgi:site-specific recombinase XerD